MFLKSGAALPFVLLYCRYRGNRYISDAPKATPAGRERILFLFVQTNAKINPCFYLANMQSCKCELVDR